MKKKWVIIGVCMMSLSYTVYRWNAKPENTDLWLMNVEALASGESSLPTDCIGIGSLDCPVSHQKVWYIASGYSLLP